MSTNSTEGRAGLFERETARTGAKEFESDLTFGSLFSGIEGVGLETNPAFLDHLAVSLAINGDFAGAIEQLQKAIALDPGSVKFRFNLAFVHESQGDFAAAIPTLEEAVALSKNQDWRCLAELAKVYDKAGRTNEAIKPERQALELAVKQNNQQLAETLKDALSHYEQYGATKKSP